MANFILASSSPRRKELLGGIIKNFTVKVLGKDERSRYTLPHLKVQDIAMQKSEGLPSSPDDVVISADTTVYLGGKYYGKPHTEENAVRMLQSLQGKTHIVYTGVCVRYRGKTHLFYEKSTVTFRRLTDEEIRRYVTDFRPLDKAGAYGIQDEQIVKSYGGSYTNIVGLPMEKLTALLTEMGVLQ